MAHASRRHRQSRASRRKVLNQLCLQESFDMRKHLALIATLIPFFVAAPVSAHHMAEGIVADDIYAMIDENLADSPHLDLDLTTIGTMTIVSVTVDDDDVAMVLDSISDALEGQGTQVESSLDVEISAPDADDLVTITIIERMGQGESQVP
jgi:hypothetical protein